MKDHIAAIKALLVGLGYQVYYVGVPVKPTLPYVLLWSSSGLRPAEDSVASSSDLTDTVGVTTVAANPDAVLIAQARVRGALDGSSPIVTGRATWLNLTDSRPLAVDRDITPTVTYGVDTYRLISTPT